MGEGKHQFFEEVFEERREGPLYQQDPTPFIG